MVNYNTWIATAIWRLLRDDGWWRCHSNFITKKPPFEQCPSSLGKSDFFTTN
jgi:hypothetical protein